jgi:hypothetical protein
MLSLRGVALDGILCTFSSRSEAKSKIPGWGIKSILWHMVKIDSGLWHKVVHGKCARIDSGVDIR